MLRQTFYSNNCRMFVGLAYLLILPFHVAYTFFRLLVDPMLAATVYGKHLNSYIELKEKIVVTKEDELNKFHNLHKTHENLI